MIREQVAGGPGSLVFCASQEAKDRARLVAVKVLRQDDPRTRQLVRQIVSAHQTLGALAYRHHNPCIRAVVVGGHPALVSPWVDGLDLVEWLAFLHEDAISLPTRVICDLIRGAASALDTALNRTGFGQERAPGLVHGDIKPTNLLVDRDGELKVCDFGAGFSILGGNEAPSRALQMGVIRYLSPQRRKGAPPRSNDDVYSVGILAIELLHGRWHRRVSSTNPSHDRQLSERIAELGNLKMRTEADNDALRTMLLRMVAFDPEARPRATEVAHTFRTLADRLPGPSLESFTHDYLVPKLCPYPPLEDASLGSVEITPFFIRDCDAGATPVAPWLGSRIDTEEEELVTDEPSATEVVAEETARALRALRAESGNLVDGLSRNPNVSGATPLDREQGVPAPEGLVDNRPYITRSRTSAPLAVALALAAVMGIAIVLVATAWVFSS